MTFNAVKVAVLTGIWLLLLFIHYDLRDIKKQQMAVQPPPVASMLASCQFDETGMIVVWGLR